MVLYVDSFSLSLVDTAGWQPVCNTYNVLVKVCSSVREEEDVKQGVRAWLHMLIKIERFKHAQSALLSRKPCWSPQCLTARLLQQQQQQQRSLRDTLTEKQQQPTLTIGNQRSQQNTSLCTADAVPASAGFLH